MIKKKYLPTDNLAYWIFTISIVLGLTLPKLMQDGMFQDAVLYSSVSHNLSQNIGTFWFPQYSKLNIDGLSSFHEHPPLVFGIQAIFFKVFGSSIYVERFYTFLALCINIGLIVLIWRKVFENDQKLAGLAFLPVLFWIATPICAWSFCNNMQENTLSAFALGTVLLMLYSLDSQKLKPINWIFAGILICLAVLCKGLPGFFTLSVPFIYWLVKKGGSFRQAFWQTLMLVFTIAAFFGILFSIPESKESLSIYLFERALMRIDSMPTAEYRLEILWRLFTELIPQFVLMGIIFGLAKRKQVKFHFNKYREQSLFFILIGLSAALPLALTMVQKGFYLVPALPYFSIGLAIIIAPLTLDLMAKRHTKQFNKSFLIISSILFITVLGFSWLQKGKFSREQPTMHDVYKIGEVVPKFSAITVPSEMYDEYNFILQGFLVRYFNISLDPYEKHEFFLVEKSMNINIPAHYKKVAVDTQKYDLYQQL